MGGLPTTEGARPCGKLWLFIFSGYVDASRVDEYRDAVEVFWESRASHAVVDLADLAFFGSDGLEFVLCLARVARGRAGTVTLIDADDSAVLAIEEAGWNDVVRHARWSGSGGTAGAAGCPREHSGPTGTRGADRSRRVAPASVLGGPGLTRSFVAIARPGHGPRASGHRGGRMRGDRQGLRTTFSQLSCLFLKMS